jgi:hypothetical protein
MNGKPNPTFPVIWLGETCGLMYFKDEESFFTTDLMFSGPITLDWGYLVCSEGIEWKTTVSREEKVSFRTRLKALRGCVVHTRVEYSYTMSGELSLEELKTRLIRQSENDPGDVMWQFIEHEDILKGVTASASYAERFEFLRLSVCGESEVEGARKSTSR